MECEEVFNEETVEEAWGVEQDEDVECREVFKGVEGRQGLDGETLEVEDEEDEGLEDGVDFPGPLSMITCFGFSGVLVTWR